MKKDYFARLEDQIRERNDPVFSEKEKEVLKKRKSLIEELSETSLSRHFCNEL